MPPKSSTLSAKAASIPSRPSSTQKNSDASIPTGNSARPNKSTYDQEQEQYKRETDQIQHRISELRLKIGDPNNGGGNAPLVARRKALREEMDSLREAQTREKSSRGKVSDQIRAVNDGLQRKIKELNANRAKLPFKSPAEVDAKIKQLESQIESGTMRIVEEKKALAEIQNLKKSRKLVELFASQQESIENEKLKIDELRKQMNDPASKSINDRWSTIKTELDQINTKLDESNKSRDTLFEEKNKLQDELNLVHNKKRESILRHREANEKYYAKIQEDQQRRINRQKAEREAQEKAQVEQAHLEMREQAALPAYGREIEDCKTLILYFDKLIGSVGSSTIEENGNNNDQEMKTCSTLPKIKDLRQVNEKDGFEGMVAIKKKNAEDEEFFMGGGNKKNKNKNKKSANDVASTNQPLHLPLATINALYALVVPVPMTREDVTKTIATLSEKKNWFIENQDRITKERIAEAEAKIAAAQAKFKNQLPTVAIPTKSDPSSAVEIQVESTNSKPIDTNDQAVESS